MKELISLVSGYKEFSDKERQGGEYNHSDLAQGQSPKTMVISCSDSRVIPSHIFNEKPGDLFAVRNVANLVPPFEDDGNYHGTSAALEFAVLGLNVKRIVIMGHSQCGGIKACDHNYVNESSTSFFIDKWLSILKPVAEKVLKDNPDMKDEERQKVLETEAIKQSIENLKTFPFIQESIAKKELTLHGAYFEIEDGQLSLLDKESGAFEDVN